MGRGFRLLSLVPLIGTGLQGLIGAFVVWLHLHPGLVSPHFLISPVLVAVATVLLVRLYEGNGPIRLVVPRPLVAVFAIMAAAGFTVLVQIGRASCRGRGPGRVAAAGEEG